MILVIPSYKKNERNATNKIGICLQRSLHGNLVEQARTLLT